MRFARLALMALALAAPLRAQDVTPVSSGPLTATLHFASYGDMWFDANKPAYFAVFDLTYNNLVQLHPYWGSQSDGPAASGASRQAAMYGRPNVYMAQRSTMYANMYGSPYGYPMTSRVANGGMHTLLLVASTRPLSIGSPMQIQRLLNELTRRGHTFDLDREEGIEALVNLITPGARDDEVAVDLLPVQSSQLWASDIGYDGGAPTIYCGSRFSSVYDWFPWQFTDYYCNPRYLNPYFPPPAPPAPVSPTRATEAMVAVPLKMYNSNSTSDPEEIRRVIDRLREYDAQRAANGYIDRSGIGGAEANNLHQPGDSRRTFSTPLAPTGQGAAVSRNAPASGPNDMHRPAPVPANGRTFSDQGYRGSTPSYAPRRSWPSRAAWRSPARRSPSPPPASSPASCGSPRNAGPTS